MKARWSYTDADYRQMYDLQSNDRTKKILTVTELPVPSFKYHEFDLVLCSNVLFHNHRFSSIQLVQQLMQAATEVRFFPLFHSDEKTVELLGHLMLQLQQENYGVEVRETTCASQKDYHGMLRVWAKECAISD